MRDTPTSEPRPYTTPARVLLNGLGADELLGGYSRHRASYETGGWQAVIDEVIPVVCNSLTAYEIVAVTT